MTAHSEITGYLTPQDVARAELIGVRGGKVGQIAAQVAEISGIPAREILGKNRRARISQARWLVWFIARQQGMTLEQIARATGHDHTTVLHGIRREEAARRAEAQA